MSCKECQRRQAEIDKLKAVCLGKRRFASHSDAKAADVKGQHAYKCGDCNWWHLYSKRQFGRTSLKPHIKYAGDVSLKEVDPGPLTFWLESKLVEMVNEISKYGYDQPVINIHLGDLANG